MDTQTLHCREGPFLFLVFSSMLVQMEQALSAGLGFKAVRDYSTPYGKVLSRTVGIRGNIPSSTPGVLFHWCKKAKPSVWCPEFGEVKDGLGAW